MALYDELAPIQTQLEANGLRLRYGVVPYSSTVNVGALIRGGESATISSDTIDLSDRGSPISTGRSPNIHRRRSRRRAGHPDLWQLDLAVRLRQIWPQRQLLAASRRAPTTGGGPPPAATWTRTFSNNESAGVDWGWTGASDTSGTTRSCRRRYVETDTTYVVTAIIMNHPAGSTSRSRWTSASTSWATPINIATSMPTLRRPTRRRPTGGTYDLIEAAASGVERRSSTNVTWNGCIEERDTVSTITRQLGLHDPDRRLRSRHQPDPQ